MVFLEVTDYFFFFQHFHSRALKCSMLSRPTSGLTYKDGGFGLDAVFIQRSPLTVLDYKLQSVALLPIHICSL
jgi:hypothetical protein